MKLKSLLFSAVLGAALTTSAFADTTPAPQVKNILSEFASSHLNTDPGMLAKIMSNDAILKFTKGNEVLSQSPVSILKLMRQNPGMKQNCSATIDVLASSPALVMAKVNFIYENFTIENYLTLELDKSQVWKITRINKFFIEK